MIGDQRHVDEQGHPFATQKKEKIQEDVRAVLGNDQRIQRFALFDRILVIIFQFIEGNDLVEGGNQHLFENRSSVTYVPDGEEDQQCGENQRKNVSESDECKSHEREFEDELLLDLTTLPFFSFQ